MCRTRVSAEQANPHSHERRRSTHTETVESVRLELLHPLRQPLIQRHSDGVIGAQKHHSSAQPPKQRAWPFARHNLLRTVPRTAIQPRIALRLQARFDQIHWVCDGRRERTRCGGAERERIGREWCRGGGGGRGRRRVGREEASELMFVIFVLHTPKKGKKELKSTKRTNQSTHHPLVPQQSKCHCTAPKQSDAPHNHGTARAALQCAGSDAPHRMSR
jgi:hypothetical protein